RRQQGQSRGRSRFRTELFSFPDPDRRKECMTQLTDPEGDEVDAGRKISGILADHQGFTLLHYLGRRSPHETSGPVIELYLNREREEAGRRIDRYLADHGKLPATSDHALYPPLVP